MNVKVYILLRHRGNVACRYDEIVSIHASWLGAQQARAEISICEPGEDRWEDDHMDSYTILEAPVQRTKIEITPLR